MSDTTTTLDDPHPIYDQLCRETLHEDDPEITRPEEPDSDGTAD